MNLRNLAISLASIFTVTSCDKGTHPVQVTETRQLTSHDKEGNLQVTMPSEWRRVPSTKFRDFNCKFAKEGEVYISIGTGSIKSNAERWLKQFGDEKEVNLAELETLDVLGNKAVILEAEGSFAGMRGIKKENAALLGLLVEAQGNLITVKMIGDATEVRTQRDNFKAFSQSIKWK